MSALSAVLAVALMCLTGAVPARWISSDPVLRVPLACLVGALLGAFAALLTVLLPGQVVTWWAVLAVVAALLTARGGRPALLRGALSSLVVVLALAVPLLALRTPDVFYDARSIWFLHARWLATGHDGVRAALANPAFVFSHPDYPPLTPAAVAGAWRVTGSGSDERLAQVLVALLNACAVLVLALGVTRAATGQRVRGAFAPLVGFLLVIACFGIAGRYATDGYADLLWSTAAVAAVVWGLVLPPLRETTAIAALCCVVAATTKNEGLATGLIIEALVLLRWTLHDGHTLRSSVRRIRRSLPWSGPTALATVAWTSTVHALGVASDVAAGGNVGRLLHLDQSVLERVRPTFAELWAYLHVVPLGVGVALACCLLLAPLRHRAGLGHPAWTAVVAASSGVTLVLAYLLNPIDITFLVQTSMDRTTIFLRELVAADLAVWSIIAVGRLHTRGRARNRIGSGPPCVQEPALTGSDPVRAEHADLRVTA